MNQSGKKCLVKKIGEAGGFMKRFLSSLAAIMVAVAMVVGYVPALEVRAEGMANCTGLTFDAGAAHSIAIRTDGNLWAWGENRNGQLGDGSTINRYSPVRIIDNVVAISVGAFYSLAIRTNGSLWACA